MPGKSQAAFDYNSALNPDATSDSPPVKVADFLLAAEERGRISRADRLIIVAQALLIIEMNYVHLPLKRAMHAIDPAQQLRLLQFYLRETPEHLLSSALDFHRQMIEIFGSTRDLHTLYLLPEPYQGRVAYLPFLIEQCFVKEDGRLREKFIVSRAIKEGKPVEGEGTICEAGVEVLCWNGIPIRRAIELNGERQSGSNAEARFAQGLDSLTIRPLDSSVPPDEYWVDVTYKDPEGTVGIARWDWLITGDALPQSRKTSTRKSYSIDIRKSRINEVKRELYAGAARVDSPHDVMRAETRTIGGRDYGYIRLFSFEVGDTNRFVKRFSATITAPDFPQDGLILDVRGNGGGKIRAGERILQLLTPNRIQPELFEFINSPLNLELLRNAPKSWGLGQWIESMSESVVTGAAYSNGFPVNSVESCNDIGQIYHGPVVLITDALSYSTTDMFAAGFQDNGVGVVLGTSGNTGAGGANLWWYEDLQRAFGKKANSPYLPLPQGAGMVLAMRRSIRVGSRAGRPLEELGVTPDERHYVTRRDLLESNADLIAHAARILRRKPSYTLRVTPGENANGRFVDVQASSKVPTSKRAANIDRLDIFVNGRPLKTIDATSAGTVEPTAFTCRDAAGPHVLVEVHARTAANTLVAARRLKV